MPGSRVHCAAEGAVQVSQRHRTGVWSRAANRKWGRKAEAEGGEEGEEEGSGVERSVAPRATVKSAVTSVRWAKVGAI